MIRLLFSRRWWSATLLVLLGIGVMLRLSIWQLDRLGQRRAANEAWRQTLTAAPLHLNDARLPADLAALENRAATVTGVFDFASQMALLVQTWQGQPGIHLVAPLRLSGSETAVLVDRGWIPQTAADPSQWAQFDEAGEVTLSGYLALSQTVSRKTAVPTPTAGQTGWYRLDIAAMQTQIPYPLLPIYFWQAPSATTPPTLPYRVAPEITLTEGSHLNYAIQWLLFSLILGGGYLYLVRQRTPHI